MSVCIAPYVLTTIMKEYHASVFQIALIPVIIQAGGFLALPMAIAFSNFNCKKVSISLYSAGRLFLIVFLVALIYPNIERRSIPIILLSTYAIMQILSMSATGPTNSWFKEIIPHDIQATFLGKRSALCALVVGSLTPAVGFFMEKHDMVDLDKKSVYMILFAFAIIVGYVDMYFLGKVETSSIRIKRKIGQILQEVKSVWKRQDIWNASFIAVIADIGTFLIVPFLILLYYDMGLGEFKVGIIVAISTLGVAAGLVTGGHFSDRLLVKKVFMLSSLLRTFSHLCFFMLTILVFSYSLPKIYIFIILATIAPMATFSGSCIVAANIKYVYNSVKDGSSISFAFIHFVRNFVVLIILASVAKFGAFLSSRSDILSAYLWNGFHYIQILFLCSIILSLFSCIYLYRANVYKNVSLR